MRSRLVACALVLGFAGCGNAKFGTDSSELVGPGAPLGDVIAKHGAPRNVRVLDSSNLIIDYPIQEVSGFLGARVKERGSSLAYSGRRSKDGGSWVVAASGWVGEGESASGLGMRGDSPMVKARSDTGILVLVATVGSLLLGFSIANRKIPGVKRATLAAVLLLLASQGRHQCGTEATTLAAPGSPAGQAVMNHGAPDEVFALPGDGGAILCWWRHKSACNVVQGFDELSSIAYFVQAGKVQNCGYASCGEASYLGFPCYELERGHRGADIGTLGWILVLAGAFFTLGSHVGRFSRAAPVLPDPPKLQAEP